MRSLRPAAFRLHPDVRRSAAPTRRRRLAALLLGLSLFLGVAAQAAAQLAFQRQQPDITLTVGDTLNVILPGAIDSTGGLAYTLADPDGIFPIWLHFRFTNRRLTGTPTTVVNTAETTTLTYTATDDNATVSQMFTVTVRPGFAGTIADQAWSEGVTIDDLTLPAATGGTAAYILAGPSGALPDGLTFTAATRTLSGTPATAVDTTLTYTATVNSVPATLMFTVTVEAERRAVDADVHRAILPQVARAMTDSVVDAISGRIRQAADGAAGAGPAFRLGGAETLHDALAAGAGPAFRPSGNATRYDALATHAPTAASGALDLPRLLNGSSFLLPLNAANNGPANPAALAFWGRGDYRNLKGGDGLNWDGGLASASIGLDGRPRPDILLGVVLAYSDGAFDYNNAEDEYDITMTSVHPYLGLSLPHGVSLWATFGYGEGKIEIAPQGGTAFSVDADLRSVALGASGQLLSAEGWLNMPGATAVRLKSEASATRIDVNGDAATAAAALSVDATRFRLALEGTNERALASGATVSPSLELGMRYDGGDGDSGAGLELGGGVRYTNPATGLSVAGKARVLLGRDDYDEWGIQGSLAMRPGADGQGLSFSLSPGYGPGASGVPAIGAQDLRAEAGAQDGDYGARLDMRLGYGLSAPGGRGLLTPYGEMTLGGASKRYRLGMRWERGSLFDLKLVGERREDSGDAAEHALLLQGAVRF